MKFGFIAKHRSIWPVAWLCEAMGASRSGFHAWLNRSPSARTRSDEAVGQQVKASFLASDRTYGTRRVWRDLLADGVECGLHRIERLMRLQALRARPRRRRLPKDDGDRQVANVPANLLDRQFAAERPNQKWIADFTYIWTAEGWLYVSAVIDLFSRRVVGWSMSASMTAQLGRCITRIGAASTPASSSSQRHRLQHEPVRQRLGQCGDGELLLLAENGTHRAQNLSHHERGQSRCVRLPRFYNATRRHSTIGYVSPVEFERKGGISLTGCPSNRQQLKLLKQFGCVNQSRLWIAPFGLYPRCWYNGGITRAKRQ